MFKDDGGSKKKKGIGEMLNQWLSLRDQTETPKPAEKEKSAEELAWEREARLVNTLVTGDPDELKAKHPIEDPADRELVLQGIRDGRITDLYWGRVLEHIPGPSDDWPLADIYQSIADDKHARRIIAGLTGLGMDNINGVDVRAVGKFIRKYPSPIAFEKDSEDFLDMIFVTNGNEKYTEYLESMDEFKHKVYGEKQDYWESAKDLEWEAKNGKGDSPEFVVIEGGKNRAEEVNPARVNTGVAEIVEEKDNSNKAQLDLEVGKVEIATGQASESELAEWEKDIRKLLVDNKLSFKNREAIVGKIECPLSQESPAEIFEVVSSDYRKMQLLQRAIGKGFDQFMNAEISDVEKFAKKYGSLVKYEVASKLTLRTLETIQDASEFSEYKKALEGLQRDLYGKQVDCVELIDRISQ